MSNSALLIEFNGAFFNKGDLFPVDVIVVNPEFQPLFLVVFKDCPLCNSDYLPLS